MELVATQRFVASGRVEDEDSTPQAAGADADRFVRSRLPPKQTDRTAT